MPTVPDDLPVKRFATQRAWLGWLEKHHAAARGVWLQMAKKGAATRSLSFAEALDGALCYGWIDGQRRGLDAESYLQRFTPRGKRSSWSNVNREHVARLIASGAMQPAGLAAIEAAKADGRWDRAYDSPRNARLHPEFEAALAERPGARAFFETLRGMSRYAFLYRIQTAVRPETRAKRIREFVAMLERGETLR